MCSTFFKKANSAAAGVGVIYFFSYLPFIFISIRYEKMNLFTKILACFVNNLGMAEGIQLIGMFEGKGTGIDWSNWTKGLSVDDDFSLFQVMVVLLADNFIYLIMFNYFEQVIPSDHGITKKWNFPIQSFFGSSETSNYTESNTSFLNETDKNQRDINTIRDINGMKFQSSTDLPVFIEDETIYSSKAIGIKINNITKTFKQLGTVKKAVDNLSLNIYEEQITVLLGHNGAGKRYISFSTYKNFQQIYEIFSKIS
jgi:ATP-binding cassette subfamily A (ABC1) protein 3